ncbi:MAG: DUF4893 domain-containing protein [Methylobacterium mesophilicum]|nr:DUF4893 domain-containing protein [Methylobacterium mesophilicum]
MIRRFAFALCLSVSASTAFADGDVQRLITPSDRSRLDKYEATKKLAFDETRKNGDAEQRKRLSTIAALPQQSFQGLDLTGAWQCRVTKVAGIAVLVTYDWFRCRVSDDGSGWKLNKLNGSQRVTGRFYDDGATRMIFLGSGFIAGEKPKAYGKGPESDQVGYAFRSGPQAWRIEFPAPLRESKLDVLEFRR